MKKSLTAGTLIIIGAGLIIKSIGFATRIIISNAVGAEGLGLYQLFYPFYSLVILTISSGITIAQSGLISEASTRGHWEDVRKITSVAFYLTLSVSVVAAVGIYFTSEEIANYIFREDRLTLSIKLFAPFIPFITVASVLRGYFYGLGNISPTAISGIVEQIAKIGVVLVLSTWAAQFGLAYACLVLAIGLVAGELANLIVLAIPFAKDFRNRIVSKEISSNAEIFRKISRISIPVSLNRFILSVLAASEMIFIKSALTNSGIEYSFSLEEFGRLTGMVMPLIFFPMILTNAIATTLVPAISEAIAQDDSQKCTKRISKAILFSIASGLVFTGIFLSYPDEIGWMTYRSVRCGDMLYLMGFACTFIYLQQTLTGILNGLAKQGVLFINTTIGFVIRMGAIFLLIPVYGINGYIYGVICSSLFVCILNYTFLSKHLGLCLEIGKFIIRPLIVCAILVFASGFILSFINALLGEGRIGVFLSVALMGCLGYFLMFLFRILDIKEFLVIFQKRKGYG